MRGPSKYQQCPVRLVALISLFGVISLAAKNREVLAAADQREQLTTDPLAQTPWISVGDWYTPSFYDARNSASDSLTVRGLLPFRTGALRHVARLTLPFEVKSPPEGGQNFTEQDIADVPTGGISLGDIGLYDLVIFDVLNGRFGIGPTFLFPTAVNSGSRSGKWCIGPAFGFVTERERWQLGMFSQNLFSIAGDPGKPPVKQSKLQPIVKYSLGKGWSVGSSSMNFTYSWRRKVWYNLPVGLKISKLTNVETQAINLSIEAEYNASQQRLTPVWTMRFTVVLFFPQS